MRLPVSQARLRPGIIELAQGYPAAGALPVAAWAQAVAGGLREYGSDALMYGHPTGPGPLLRWLCDRLGAADGRVIRPGEVFVTAGASHALELVASLVLRPGDAVLVDSPTYHLALRVLADHARLVPAPADEHGLLPDETAKLLDALRAKGVRVPLLYLVPTYNNPTGGCLPQQRRLALVRLARRRGLLLVEDDTYRELAYDAPAPRSLYGLAEAGEVIRLGSFAKTVAPGIRLGFLCATEEFVARLADRGYVDSGGGVNHTNAVAMGWFGGTGAYDEHLGRVRERYRYRRDSLVRAVAEHLPAARFAVPAGGWFLWLRLSGVDTGALLPVAERHGVGYLPGARCFLPGAAGPAQEYLRLSFSMVAPELFAEGIRRLAAAVVEAQSVRSGV
ncbi:MAG: PLP-dependent aminotransferase family protein [Micromonosporaceae bacterium]|nr:PLP-dependent aminotransferase family protein [Micromonosporaceae bacterium]